MIMSEKSIGQQFSVREKAGAVKVLLVNDDSDATELMKAVLDPASFIVVNTDSACKGGELVSSFHPAVMVIELTLGPDSLNILKDIRMFSDVPILVISAINTPGIVAQALNCGADDYLTKPMKSSLLVAYIRKLARRARAEKEIQRRNGKQQA
jgi:DNA-binding response OmpR family regulator